MSYQIVIPSYKRSAIVQERTLTTLKSLGICKDLIHLFVVQEDLEDYQATCNPDYYGQIIVGLRGLAHQRDFISKYYPVGTQIVSLDDDIESLDLSLTEYKTADEFFKVAFQVCNDEGAYIWGIYPVFNAYFRKNRKPITTDLTYIVGAIYGYINRPADPELDLKIALDGDKEDVERTLLYWKKDKKVIRFNRVGFKTKYYGTDGGGLGKFKDRIGRMAIQSGLINKAYPDITKIKVRKNGMTEILFRPNGVKPTKARKAKNILLSSSQPLIRI